MIDNLILTDDYLEYTNKNRNELTVNPCTVDI